MKISMNSFITAVLFLTLLLTGCATHIPLEAPIKHCGISTPTTMQDHYTHYVLGDRPVTLFCKPLMLSEIRLPPTESILSINTGDSERWLFQTIVSNSDNNATTHILIKPKENNINTNLIVATNQRIYRITLISREVGRSQHSITFIAPISQGSPGCFNSFDSRYEVSVPFFQKKPYFLPRSIYNDGKSVFISIPNLSKDIAPTFYVLDEQNQPTIVNYQVINNCYRIDHLFTKGVLIKGVGRKQLKIIIKHKDANE